MQFKKKKIFVIAGEISGDNIAYSLVSDFIKLKKYDIKGVGGQKLKKLGIRSIFKMEKISLMGIFEIIPKIPLLLFLIRKTIIEILKYNPDLLIMIDAPGFNFRVAKKIKKIAPNIKILHVVAPTVWAWKASRAKKISNIIDHLFTLYSFEKKYFTAHNLETTFIGHPLFSDLKNKSKNQSFKNGNRIISIYPGSRKNEIDMHLEKILIYLSRLENKKNIKFQIIAVDLYYDYIKRLVSELSINIKIIILKSSKYKNYSFKNSFLAIAVSGTITLELAMHLVPVICVYKLNKISYFLLKKMVKTKYISLVNIIMKTKVIPELIQYDFNCNSLLNEVSDLLKNKEEYNYQKKMFNSFRNKIIFKKKVALNQISKLIN